MRCQLMMTCKTRVNHEVSMPSSDQQEAVKALANGRAQPHARGSIDE